MDNKPTQNKTPNNITDVLSKLKKKGDELLSRSREIAYSPELEKRPREYTAKQACELIGVSQSLLKSRENTRKIILSEKNEDGSNKFFEPRRVTKGKRTSFTYNLAEINLIRDHFGKRPSKPKKTNTRIFAVTNFKGGSAKSTTSLHLAHGFALKGYKVLLVDCDSQGSSTIMSGLNPDQDLRAAETICNVLLGKTKSIKNIIRKTNWSGLDLIPANLSLYFAELMVPGQMSDLQSKGQDARTVYNRLNNALNEVRNDYDLIILDTAPSVGIVTTNVLMACNGLLIPTIPSIVDYASTLQFMSMITGVLDQMDKTQIDFLRILITKNNGKNTAIEMENIIRTAWSSTVLSNSIMASEAISRAATNMKSLYEVEEILGDRKSYKKALDQVNFVVDEIEIEMKRKWARQEKAYQAQNNMEELQKA